MFNEVKKLMQFHYGTCKQELQELRIESFNMHRSLEAIKQELIIAQGKQCSLELERDEALNTVTNLTGIITRQMTEIQESKAVFDFTMAKYEAMVDALELRIAELIRSGMKIDMSQAKIEVSAQEISRKQNKKGRHGQQ